MHIDVLELLRCPKTGERLTLQEATHRNGEVYSGWLVSKGGTSRYPITEFIPRFVASSNYADNFGMQWNAFRKTQLDSFSGQPISANRFWNATGWLPSDINGAWVLDAGCGAGRFAEIALQAGAKLVAIDFSSAVDACFTNLRHHRNLHVLQADIYSLPLETGFFPYVFSLGVLQHTPNVKRAFQSLVPMLSDEGRLCVDVYWKRLRTMLHGKYLLRPITRHISQQQLFNFLKLAVPALLPISQSFGKVPGVGPILKRLIPVANYQGVYPLNSQQLLEWALLDTFDMLAPQYDNPQSSFQVRRWFEDSGLVEVEVFQEGHLVGRACKTSGCKPNTMGPAFTSSNPLIDGDEH